MINGSDVPAPNPPDLRCVATQNSSSRHWHTTLPQPWTDRARGCLVTVTGRQQRGILGIAAGRSSRGSAVSAREASRYRELMSARSPLGVFGRSLPAYSERREAVYVLMAVVVGG